MTVIIVINQMDLSALYCGFYLHTRMFVSDLVYMSSIAYDFVSMTKGRCVMYKKLLVPYDNSESSRRALENALDLVAGVADAHITVLNVVEWHDYNAETFKIASRMSGAVGESLDMDAISEINSEAEAEETKRIKDDIADIVGDSDIVDIAIVNGSPHIAIVQYASDQDYDCIVMGHRGMGLIRGMLGSVAFSVLNKADKPVLVVK